MFTEKEACIIKALIEEEIGDVLDNGLDGEALFEDYYHTLKNMILKVSCGDHMVRCAGRESIPAQPIVV